MNQRATDKRKFSGLQVTVILLLAIVITLSITLWLVWSGLFTDEFPPVTLSQSEETVLKEKLAVIGVELAGEKSQSSTIVEPERYSEAGANREISFSERELNAVLAKNTDLANKLAIDLSDDLISAKLLLPLDEQLPFVGGRTLKVTAGLGVSYNHDKPEVIVKGVSIWGVPVPGAYLGDIKNVDLIEKFGESGFWKNFSDGIDDLKVTDGSMVIRVKE